MKEIVGDLWDYHRNGYTICVTTNGTVSQSGKCIMGAGSAKICKQRYPDTPKLLGMRIMAGGNHMYNINNNIFSFPTKHNWYDPSADLDLIIQSAKELQALIDTGMCKHPFILPRPGCGFGRLDWETQVKPAIKDLLSDEVWVITDK